MIVKCKIGNCNYRDKDTEFCRKAVIRFYPNGCMDFSLRGEEEIKEEEKEKIILEDA